MISCGQCEGIEAEFEARTVNLAHAPTAAHWQLRVYHTGTPSVCDVYNNREVAVAAAARLQRQAPFQPPVKMLCRKVGL